MINSTKMRKTFLCLLFLLAFGGIVRAQGTATVTIDAGLLENSTGTAAVPVGGLLQLIASTSGTFTAPTSNSYVGNDSTNVVLANFAMNYSSGTTGETVNGFSPLTLPATVTTGEKLLLRFYPNLTLASMPSAPTLGTAYGQVRSDSIEFGAAGGDANETAWVVPASGQTIDLDYITVNDNGTYGNATAYATGVVLAVPEPSSLVIQGGLALGLLGWTLRRSRV